MLIELAIPDSTMATNIPSVECEANVDEIEVTTTDDSLIPSSPSEMSEIEFTTDGILIPRLPKCSSALTDSDDKVPVPKTQKRKRKRKGYFEGLEDELNINKKLPRTCLNKYQEQLLIKKLENNYQRLAIKLRYLENKYERLQNE